MTADEYYALPEGPPYFQLIDGELFMSPSPNFFHQEIVINIASPIREYLRRNPIGKVVIAPSDVEFDKGNIYQPDVFFIRNERLGMVDKHGAKGAPDLVVEVISGSTGRLDLGPKKMIYAAKGVVEFWAVLPRTLEIEIYRFHESADAPIAIMRSGETVTTSLLPGFELAVAEIFAQ